MCILGIPEQVDVNMDAECISVEKGETPTLIQRLFCCRCTGSDPWLLHLSLLSSTTSCSSDKWKDVTTPQQQKLMESQIMCLIHRPENI